MLANSEPALSRRLQRAWRRVGVILGILAVALAPDSVRAAPAKADKVDFNFQVRPILADRCFKCHGPDAKSRKADLRLDLPESAYALRDTNKQTHAIVPLHPDRSELIRRITTKDDDDRMPPPASNLNLSDEEKALLRRWVAEGAQYQTHWAFSPVRKPALPEVQTRLPVGNAIDRFVVARLQKEGLTLSPEASRETLIRRLSFDLRGLPPTLQEIDQFLANPAPDAYERLVDTFLASPAYGEHMANDWLDLARFADTYGYQADVERDMSPWRDWVIRAFNSNLPYDKFVLWQVAGDLLPSPSRDQILATAFNRLHRQTNEGGSVEEEFRVEYVSDRVATAGTAFLGLTLGCARCHDHKYDPVSQKNFYEMSAFFNSIDESGLYAHFTHATPSPALLLFKPGEQEKHEAMLARIRAKETAQARLSRGRKNAFQTWLNSKPNIPRPVPVAAFNLSAVTDGTTPDRMGTNRAVLVDNPILEQGRTGKALKFSGDNSVECKGAGVFHRSDTFSFGLWLKPTEKQERAVVFHRSRAWTDSGSRGYELLLEDGKPTFSLIHFWPGNALKVAAATTTLPLNQWSHVTITYDGLSHAAGVRLYLNGQAVETTTVRDNLYKDIVHRAEWGDADVQDVHLTLAGRFRDSGFKNGLIEDFEVFDRCLTPFEARLVADPAPKKPTLEELRAYYVASVDGMSRGVRADLQGLREEEDHFINDVREISVMKEMPKRRPTYVLKRGAYDAHGDPVQPNTPEKILPFSPSFPRNRLGLAKWLLDPKNPLTARVAVNRAWREHFGRGLVLTEEDFGTQGKLPTHPELLDWLSATFVENKWDLKALHKLIVFSATYRQSSAASPELLAKDPDNQWLARGPKHRLRAEEIRDNALAVSGLLSTKIGGPSVKPYQPDGLWEQSGTASHYTQDKGEGLYRRSLYTFWKRIVPPPNMVIFDAPTREVCTARRETTTTPLQALVLLNDPQYVEAARVMAENLILQCGSDSAACVARAFRMVTGRNPQARELEVLQALYREQLHHFESDPTSAESYLHIGERAPNPALPKTQLAATAVLASALMNMDEFVTER